MMMTMMFGSYLTIAMMLYAYISCSLPLIHGLSSMNIATTTTALNNQLRTLCKDNELSKAETLLLQHVSCMLDMNSSRLNDDESRERFENQIQSIVKLKEGKQISVLDDSCNTMDSIVSPDSDSLDIVLLGWSKQKSYSRRADDLLVKFVQLNDLVNEYDDLQELIPTPTVNSYGLVLNGLVRCGAAERSEEILNQMEDIGLEPNSHCYISCINAWAHSKFRLAHRKAEILIKKMIKEDIPVGKVAYTSLMNCYRAVSEEDDTAALRCEEVLNKMITLSSSSEKDYSGLTPDVVSYTTAIEAWSRSSDREAALKADKILFSMLHNDDTPNPTARTFRASIKAWVNSRHPSAAEHIEEIIQLMEDNHKKTGDLAMKPSSGIYGEYLTCLARSRDGKKARKAATVLKKVIDEYKSTEEAFLRPNRFLYNGVINVCAHCKHDKFYNAEAKQDALKIAFAVLRSFENDKFDTIYGSTYATLLRATENLMPKCEARDDIVKAIFAKVSSAGLVEENLAHQVLALCSDISVASEIFGNALAEADVSGQKHTGRMVVHTDKLPSEWTRNTSKTNQWLF